MSGNFRIAFGNKSRVGKDESCKYLMEKYQAQEVRFASSLYDCQNCILQRLGLPLNKNPQLLQLLGEGCRNIFGRDIWLEQTIKYIETLDQNKPIVIADLRHKNEAAAMKKLGFTLVKINRRDRPIDRDPNHISEVDLDNYPFDYEIDNNGTLEELYGKLESRIRVLY